MGDKGQGQSPGWGFFEGGLRRRKWNLKGASDGVDREMGGNLGGHLRGQEHGHMFQEEMESWLGAVAHACNPSTLGG